MSCAQIDLQLQPRRKKLILTSKPALVNRMIIVCINGRFNRFRIFSVRMKLLKALIHEDSEKYESWADKYPREKTLILYCAWPNEATSARTAQRLKGKGFQKIYALKGGWRDWKASAFPIQKKLSVKQECAKCHMQKGDHAVRTAWGFFAVRLPMTEDKQWASDRAVILQALGMLDGDATTTARLNRENCELCIGFSCSPT